MALLGSTEFDLIFKMVDEVSGKLSGISNQIDGLGKKATGASGGPLKGLLGGLGGVATMAAGMLTAGLIQNVAGQIVGLGKEALGAVISFEQLSLSMESLVAREIKNVQGLDSMQDALAQAGPRAKELLGWIQELAIKSPFDQEGVAIAFRTALAYGFTTEQAQKLTQVTIDYATASGQGVEVMNRITLALGQISARGKLTGGDMLQLVNAGVNVRAILEGMGYSMEDVSKGVVEADAFIQAFTKTMEDDFGGAAERSSGTWGGLLNSLGDIKKIALREFFGGIFEAVKPLVQSLTDWLLGPGLPKIKEWGAAVAAFAKDVVAGVLDVVGKIQDLVGAFQEGGANSEGFKDALGAIIGSEAVDNIYQVVDGVTALIESFQNVGALQTFKDIIGNLFGGEGVAKFEEIQKVVEEVWAQIQNVIGAALEVIQPAWEAFVAGVQEGFSNLQPLIEAFQELWVNLGPAITAILGALGVAIAAVVGVVVGLFSGIAQAIAPFIQMIVAVVTNVVTIITGIVQVITGVLQLIWGAVTGNQKLIEQGTEKFKAGLMNIWTGLVNGIHAIVTGVFNTISAFIAGFGEGIAAYFTSLWTRVTGGTTTATQNIKTSFMNGLNSLLTSISTWATGIVDKFRTMGTNAANALKNFNWRQAGRDIVSGIANGITSAAQWAVNAIIALARSMWNSLTNFFQSDSPSKLTFGLGENITAGIAKGLQFSTPVAVKASEETASAVYQPLRATTVGGGGGGGVSGGDTFISINVYPSEGMSENALAEQIRQKLQQVNDRSNLMKRAGYRYTG